MGSGSKAPPKPPPPPPPPPPIRTSRSLWDPVGDPGKLRACAAAWTALGGSLSHIAGSLDASSSHLGASWSGTAYNKFQGWSGKYTGLLDDLAGDCSTMAGHLDTIANYLEEKNAEIHHLYEAMIATAAVGIGLSIVTFGFSDAAAAAAGAAEVAEAEGIVAAIGSFLGAMGESMASTLATFAGRWALAFSINLAVDQGVSLVEGHGLDFSPDTLASAINGATFSAVLPDGFLKGVPFSGAIRGAIAGFSGSFATTAMDGDPFTIQSLKRDLVSAGISGGVGQTFDWAWPEGEAPEPQGSTLIDPSTGLPFGQAPEPVQLIDPTASSPGAPLIDPSTNLPFGVTPPAVTLVGPGGEVISGPAPDPAPLINPSTGQPFNAPPGQIVVTDSAGNPVGEVSTVTLVGPNGQPLISSSPSTGISIPLPQPRAVVEGTLDKGSDMLVELVMPESDAHYRVQTLIVPVSDVQALGPAPVGSP